ncbi:hypothetical protein BDV29DRAFT_181205 [Aspergillus leporis]|uniref:Secreted protein n=1 Tax=Aspergillus leporis TaxID=41062 RepID=A0A5N5WNX7_9EURO|nr:hypothetical protein BDV29DRAFT_181205 [Aspergillus leporis]
MSRYCGKLFYVNLLIITLLATGKRTAIDRKSLEANFYSADTAFVSFAFREIPDVSICPKPSVTPTHQTGRRKSVCL